MLKDGSVHFAEKQGRLVTFLHNFLHVFLHDYLLLPQSKLLAGKIQHYGVLINNFLCLLEACGDFCSFL